MADADGHGILDDVLVRVRALPERVRSLRVETKGWTDFDLSWLASDRARGLLVERVPRRSNSPERRSESRARSWMEFGADGWGDRFIEVWPARWRQEVERTEPDVAVVTRVSGRDGDSYWTDDGDGVNVFDARELHASLVSAWVVGRRWVGERVQREVLDVSESVLGRPAMRVRLSSEPGVHWDAGPYFAGDLHEILVDVTTGMTLGVSAVVDGRVFHHDEVVDLEIDAPVAAALTEVPEGAEARSVSQRFRAVEEVAAEAQLVLLAPRWLPPEYSFQTGSASVRDGVPQATLVFSRDRREFIQLFESPESRDRGEDTYVWERVKRGSRIVMISDGSDQPGQRVAYAVVGGTVAVIYAPLDAVELLDLAFSLEPVTA
jgi:hypothetical protein